MDKLTASAWMKYLKPVVVGVVAMMSAATLALQRYNNGDVDSRVTALEIEMKMNNKHDEAQDLLSDNFRVMHSDIRSDVAYIRGKMEGGK